MGALESTQEPGFIQIEPALYMGRPASRYTGLGIDIHPEHTKTPEMFETTLAHEIGHAIDSTTNFEDSLITSSMLPWSEFNKPFYSGVDPVSGNPIITQKDDIRREQAKHVRNAPEEFKSDLQALRYLMYDRGVYDIRKGKKFTKEDLERAKEKLKGNQSLERTIQAAGENGLIKLMNIIAKGDEKMEPKAQNGYNLLNLNKAGQQTGLSKFAQQGGGDAFSQLTAGIGSPKGYGVSGGGKLGGGIGSAVGTAFGGPVGGMIGKFAGQTLGNVLDKKAEKTEAANERTQRNITSMAFNQGTQGLQAQNASYMRDGGMANPQVATHLEGIPLTRLFAPDPTMDTLRAGGHLKSYTAPSERAMYTGRDKFAMGGNLETHWGGYAEPMSYNPYLPEEGETVMFRGKSHDESDGKGNTGIGITYGDSPVEVERGEPAVQLKNGSDGDNSLTVYGNLKIPKFGAEMIGVPKATGKKFKSYVADLSKTEQKQNKLIDKSVTELDNLDVNNPYDLLKFESYKANIFGANQKLKNIADEKIKLANLQSAINDTAEEYNLVADDLAQGKVKQAKKGTSIKKAQIGTEETFDAAKDLDMALVTAGRLPSLVQQMRDFKLQKSNYPQFKYSPSSAEEEEKSKFDWMTILNQILPYVRPTDAEALDPRQLSGEMLALATNQVEPVQMQTIQPQLTAPFDISLQDIINQNQSDYRSAQRLMGYNPAALAALNAQKYAANQQVLGEQFRLNQAFKNAVYADNRNILNQANLQNLQGMDQQYVRQQEALSNTKLTAQAALSSIASKYLQNQSENRTLQTYENMYNYRFDPRFRAGNMNPLAQFNTDISGLSYEQLQALADLKKSQTPVTTTNTTTIRNGGIVRAIKSM
jgi:hypothetical protein